MGLFKKGARFGDDSGDSVKRFLTYSLTHTHAHKVTDARLSGTLIIYCSDSSKVNICTICSVQAHVIVKIWVKLVLIFSHFSKIINKSLIKLSIFARC